MTDQHFTVSLVNAESRFVLRDTEHKPAQEIGEEAFVDVTVGDARHRVMYHTVVSEDYGGQGLASTLVRAAIDASIADGFLIVPVCSYVKAWVTRHPEYADHVIAVTPSHLSAVQAAVAK